MEIYTTLSSRELSSPPVPPLRGYFRFRHQMMKDLPLPLRTSEQMLRLWNELSSEQKAAQDAEIEAQLRQYHHKLDLWRNSQKIPKRSAENTTFFKANMEKQNSSEETKPEPPSTQTQACEASNSKHKAISKTKAKKTTKARPKSKKL